MVPLESLRQRLESELRVLEDAILNLWCKSRILQFRNDPSSNIVMFFPPHYWQTLSSEHRPTQAQVKTRYEHWFEVFFRCYSRYGGDVQDAIKGANEYVISAIELNTGWGTEPTFDGNRAYLVKNLGVFRSLLQSQTTGQGEYILLPDTNSLLRSAEPQHYRGVVISEQITLCLVPTVLSELDGLKRSREGQTVGEKAEKAIRIIKGLRNQGSIQNGVTVDKTITVKMIATEPRMSNVPTWLDPDNRDDRILANALEIQFDDPSKTVILVTGDMNLQNKAEMAFLPYAEPPDIPIKPK